MTPPAPPYVGTMQDLLREVIMLATSSVDLGSRSNAAVALHRMREARLIDDDTARTLRGLARQPVGQRGAAS